MKQYLNSGRDTASQQKVCVTQLWILAVFLQLLCASGVTLINTADLNLHLTQILQDAAMKKFFISQKQVDLHSVRY